MISTVAVALAALLPAALAVKPFDDEFYANPWVGECAVGEMQTPIDLPSKDDLPGLAEHLVSEIVMPLVHAPVTNNKGSSIQVAWDPMSAFDMEDDTIFPMVPAGGDSISDVITKGVKPEYMLKMIPLQIHWHETSEHSFGGMLAPMEAHIVSAVGPGEAPKDWGCDAVWEGGDPVLEKCIAVFGIVYITHPEAESPAYFKHVFDSFPLIAGAEAPYPEDTFDLQALLPEDKSYDAYIGSLTTPPCAEGLRWHVFTDYVHISQETVEMFEGLMANITDRETGERQLYRHNNRSVQPRNGRDIFHHSTAAPSDSRRMRRPRGGL